MQATCWEVMFLLGLWLLLFCISCPSREIRVALPGFSSLKSDATRFCQWVQYFRVFKRRYSCQYLGFLSYAQMLMNAIAHGGCTDTVSLQGKHTPSIAFRHLPPNSATFSYATEGALFITAQLSADAVSALRKVWVLKRLRNQPSAEAHT